MRHNLLTSLTFCLFTFMLLSQEEERFKSDKVSDCDGATLISRQGSYELEFTGNNGIYQDVSAYNSSNIIPESNSLWAQFTAPYKGSLSLSAFCPNQSIQMVIFSITSPDGCDDILNGTAEVKRLIQFDSGDTIGLKKEIENGFPNSLDLKADDSIYFYFNVKSSSRNRLKLNLDYVPESFEDASLYLTKTIDLHYNISLNTLTIKLQDSETGLPVLGQVYMNNNKTLNAMFRGTNFILDINRNSKLYLSVNAEGYFYYDKTEVLNTDTENEMIIRLEPLKAGKKMEIPGIEFEMSSSEFSPGTEVVLKRLRNFLLLNSTIHIEIQGHVNAVGENSMAGKRLSRARAKRVMRYLVESGVDKKRLDAVGYGNKFMKYPEPLTKREEQANRRVEIKIL